MSETWRWCAPDDLTSGQARRFDVPGHRIGRAHRRRLLHGRDECSHEDYSLSEGEVWAEECQIECPRHGSTFDLVTGAPCSLPATQPVAVYEVLVDGDTVAVVLP